MLGIIGCGDDEDGIYQPQGQNTPRVIAVDPTPGSKPTEAVELFTPRQEFRITFNEPIIPNSGRILFGGASIQLQGTKATDTITWNQCFRRIRFGLEPGSLVISDFVNVNYDVQPHAFEGWYWMPLFDITPPAALEYYPIGEEVDPETTREIRVVFDRPMEGKAILDISPPVEVVFMGIENEDIRECSGIATWRIVNQLEYSTNYTGKRDSTSSYIWKCLRDRAPNPHGEPEWTKGGKQCVFTDSATISSDELCTASFPT